MKFVLFVSHDCGSTYQKSFEAETLDELRPKMKRFDENMFRWYVEKDGKECKDVICKIHKQILNHFR